MESQQAPADTVDVPADEVANPKEVNAVGTASRSCLTSDGKIWPASVTINPEVYFCSKFSKKRLATLLAEQCLRPDDGKLLDVWVLTRIDHWDHDQECTICLTDQYLILIGLSFITEKIQSVKRVPINTIHTLRMGNLITPQWSLIPPREYGAIQLVWGPLASTKWTVLWNPLSNDVPAAIFHHHPCHYSIKPLEDKELFDCDNMTARLREILDIYAVQPLHENIVLKSRLNPFNVFYNQSNLGFCKDRNGVNF